MANIVEVFGNCRVVGPIASGPLTDVYHAIQDPLGRHVAIKALRSTMSPGSPFAAPLVREAELLSRLSHENILQLYDFVKTPESMWLVLEFVDGISLADLVAKLDRLQINASAALGIEIARALSHAHSRGIVHRDVKPANILIARDGHVKLVDFGIARDDRIPSCPETLEMGSTYGTPAYMSPEQILGDKIDARTDLFSLGIVLYQIVAGRRPFEAPDTKTTAQRIRHSEPPPLSGGELQVPRVFERIIARCLEKSPPDRWSTAAELASHLEAHLRRETSAAPHEIIASELVRAKIVEPPPRLRDPMPSVRPTSTKRNSFWSVAAVYLLLLVLIVAGGGFIEHQARRSEDATATHQGPLELIPTQAGHLRAVARPWAEVVIDGQRVDVTPIARAIPLRPGVHYVTFKHPRAADERRVIRIEPAQTVLLDVTMSIVEKGAPGAAGVGVDGGAAGAGAANGFGAGTSAGVGFGAGTAGVDPGYGAGVSAGVGAVGAGAVGAGVGAAVGVAPGAGLGPGVGAGMRAASQGFEAEDGGKAR